jgi:hypothetical protein
MYRSKRSLVFESKEKTAILTPIKNKQSFLVSIIHEGITSTGLIHVNEILTLLDGSLKGK